MKTRAVFASSYQAWSAAIASFLVLGIAASCTFPDPTFRNEPAPIPATHGNGEGRDDGGADAGSEGGVTDARAIDPSTDAEAGVDGGNPGHDSGTEASTDSGVQPEQPCQADCPLVTIAQGQEIVLSLAADEKAVYWISKERSPSWAKLKYRPYGGVELELYGTLAEESRSLAIDPATVFFAKNLVGSGGVFATPRTSTNHPKHLINQNNTSVVLIDAAGIFYEATNGVARIPKGGGARRELAPSGGHLLAVDGDHVIVLENALNGGQRKLRMVAKDGSQPFVHSRVLLDQAPEIDSLVADSSAFYFAAHDDGYVYRLDRHSGQLVRIADSEARPCTLRQDKHFLYWVNQATSELRAMPKLGAAKPKTIGAAQVSALAVTNGKLIWAVPDAPPETTGDILMLETGFPSE